MIKHKTQITKEISKGEKTLIDLAVNKKKPKNSREQKLLSEIESIKK